MSKGPDCAVCIGLSDTQEMLYEKGICPVCADHCESKRSVGIHCYKKHRIAAGAVENKCRVCSARYYEKRNVACSRDSGFFCSDDCLNEFRGREKPVEPLSARDRAAVGFGACPFCRETFSSGHAVKSHVPSKHGVKIAKRLRVCEHCEEEFEVEGWVERSNGGRQRHCSYSCATLARDITGEDHPMYGVTGPDHHGFKHGLSIGRTQQKLKVALSGNWQAISKQYREGVDGCERCGEDTSLDVHHIIPVSAGGTNGEYNLMALCRSCHTSVEAFTAEIVDYPLLPDGFDYGKWS